MNGKITPFKKGMLDISFEELCSRFPNETIETMKIEYDRIMSDEIWFNEEYQVNLNKTENYTHLSIKRVDKKEIHDWRDLQVIKNMLLGEDVECIELYPSENRLVDTANQYHLWYLHPNGQNIDLNFGFKNRLVIDEHPVEAKVGQRSFNNDSKEKSVEWFNKKGINSYIGEDEKVYIGISGYSIQVTEEEIEWRAKLQRENIIS